MYFDLEKIIVYQRSMEFVAFVAALLPRRQSPFGNIRDQLLRSSQSVALNIAEGNGKRSPAERRRFFEIARGSAMERAATLDVLVAVGAFSLDEITPGKALLYPVVKMLSKMTESPKVARKEMAEYGGQDALGNGQQEQEQEQESRLLAAQGDRCAAHPARALAKSRRPCDPRLSARRLRFI